MAVSTGVVAAPVVGVGSTGVDSGAGVPVARALGVVCGTAISEPDAVGVALAWGPTVIGRGVAVGCSTGGVVSHVRSGSMVVFCTT